MRQGNYCSRRFLFQTKGAVSVEFAVLLPVLLVMVFGIIDFGHAWYLQHLMSDASREGVRYGSRYQTISYQRILPKNLSPSIEDYVLDDWGLRSRLPADANPTVTPGGPGWTETDPAALATEDLIVTVNATKTWFVLGNLIPGFGSSKNLSVSTTMKCE